MKKSRRATFTKLSYPYPISPLVYAAEYPEEGKIPFFYETSKYLIAFLLLDRPAGKFPPFIEDMANGVGADEAFRKEYGMDLAELEKQFRKFAY